MVPSRHIITLAGKVVARLVAAAAMFTVLILTASGATYSNINLTKVKTFGALKRAQDYDERRSPSEREAENPEPWRAIREDLRLSTTAGNYIQHFASTRARLDGDTLTILASNDFQRHWLENKLDGQIAKAMERTGYGHLHHRYDVFQPAKTTNPNAPRIIMSRDDWAAYTQQRLEELGITPRQGKQSERYNSTLALRWNLTASPSFFHEHPEQYERWLEVSHEFIRELHGEEQILGSIVHTHQKTPHLGVTVIPIDDRGHLNAGGFARTREQLTEIHTLYNQRLREAGIHLERGHNASLEREMVRIGSGDRQRAIDANDIPLDEVLERLEAERQVHNPRLWIIGDRLIQVHEDGHGFTEVGPHGIEDGDGGLELVMKLRQEGESPAEALELAADYLATMHPERVRGGAPPLVPHTPEPRPEPPLERVSIPFGTHSRWEPGQFIVVDTPAEARQVAGAAKGWGHVVAAPTPGDLPVEELAEAITKGHMVDIATRSDAVFEAVQERYADLTAATGRQIWRRSPATLPSMAKPRAVEKSPEMEQGPLAGPEIMMGGL